MSKRITVTLPDDFAPLYEHLVDANPRSSSSEVIQEALIALARNKTNGKDKGKKKSKGKHKAKQNGTHNGYGRLPEVRLSRHDMTGRRTPQHRQVEPNDERRAAAGDGWVSVVPAVCVSASEPQPD